MTEPSLEQRVSALEQQVNVQARARASQDLDLSTLEIRQIKTNALLQELATTVSDNTRSLTVLESASLRHSLRLDAIDKKLATYGTRFDSVEAGLQTIIGMLEALSGNGGGQVKS